MLRNRNFLLLWLINIVTTLGLELFTVSILVTIFEQTGSTLQAAGTMVVRTLPSFILGPVAGIFVDRFPRKNVLISMDIGRLLMVGAAIWLLSGMENVPVITTYLLLLGLSTAEVFHRPARLSPDSLILPKAQLVQANSFIFVSIQVVAAISYTIGGWLTQTFTIAQIATSVIGVFVAAVLFALFLVVPKRTKTEEDEDDESAWQSFVSGWRYLIKHPIARPLTVMETIEHVPHGIWTGALMLAFTTQALQATSVEWGYQVTGYFSGMIAGSLVALAMSGWLSRYPGWIIVVNACLSGFMTLAFAMSQTVAFAIALAFVFGPPFAIRDVAQDALLQGTVNENQLGRVYATREMLRSTVFMFSGIFFAWLSGIYPIRIIYLAGGLMYILTGIYALTNKPLRESRMTVEADQALAPQGD